MQVLRKVSVSVASMLALAMPLMAQAQDTPSYARGDESISGRVGTFDGHFHLTVHDQRGYLDDVTLRRGTIINPTGLRLASGLSLHIMGFSSGSTFVANEIDTPYTQTYTGGGAFSDGYAYPAYPGYYGPYNDGYYGYGPYWNTGIFIGGGWGVGGGHWNGGGGHFGGGGGGHR